MSFWIRRKDKSSHRLLYLIDMPIELMFILAGILLGLIVYILRFINAH